MEESQAEIKEALRVACESLMRLHHPDSELFKTMESVIADVERMSDAEALSRYAVIAAVLEEQFSINFAKPVRIKTKRGIKTFKNATTLYKFLERENKLRGVSSG